MTRGDALPLLAALLVVLGLALLRALPCEHAHATALVTREASR